MSKIFICPAESFFRGAQALFSLFCYDPYYHRCGNYDNAHSARARDHGNGLDRGGFLFLGGAAGKQGKRCGAENENGDQSSHKMTS